MTRLSAPDDAAAALEDAAASPNSSSDNGAKTRVGRANSFPTSCMNSTRPSSVSASYPPLRFFESSSNNRRSMPNFSSIHDDDADSEPSTSSWAARRASLRPLRRKSRLARNWERKEVVLAVDQKMGWLEALERLRRDAGAGVIIEVMRASK